MDQAIFKDFKASYIPGIGIMLDIGEDAPTDGAAGYGVGCIFQATGTHAGVYINNGTVDSCNFDLYSAVDTTGTHTGPVVGDVTGDLTGTVTSAIAAGSITDTPTQAELVAILGAAAAGEGQIQLVQGNAGTGDGNVYACTSDGTNWFAAKLTAGTA